MSAQKNNMKCQKFLTESGLLFYDAFKSQDPELFDVVFDIHGKKLYADKLRLSLLSSTFKAMLSDNFWKNKNEPIPITDYSFENFKELLSFIYSGECNITAENIFIILDMAEYYHIDRLKDLCDLYLTKIKYTLSNIFYLIEISNKYSMTQIKKFIQKFLSENFTAFVKCDDFFKADKIVIEELVKMESNIAVKPEEIFQAVFEWGEHRASKKENELNDKNFNKNDAIKSEIAEFLPYINFKKMKLCFLHNYVVKRGFLFSYDEMSDILNSAHSNVNVKITNLHGQSIYGNLPHDNTDAITVIKDLKNRESNNSLSSAIFWWTNYEIISVLKPLQKRDGVQWYLIHFGNGNIGVKHFNEITANDYLLAELRSLETDFTFTTKCKIEID